MPEICRGRCHPRLRQQGYGFRRAGRNAESTADTSPINDLIRSFPFFNCGHLASFRTKTAVCTKFSINGGLVIGHDHVHRSGHQFCVFQGWTTARTATTKGRYLLAVRWREYQTGCLRKVQKLQCFSFANCPSHIIIYVELSDIPKAEASFLWLVAFFSNNPPLFTTDAR